MSRKPQKETDILEVPVNGHKCSRFWQLLCVVDVVIGTDHDDHRNARSIWSDTYPRLVSLGSVEEAIRQVLENFRGSHLLLATGDHVTVSYVLQAQDFFGRWITASNVSYIMDQIQQRLQADLAATETS